jgi:hypothetical protein
MCIQFLTDSGCDFSQPVHVEPSTSITVFFAARFPTAQPTDYLIRINGLPAVAGQMLREDDQ